MVNGIRTIEPRGLNKEVQCGPRIWREIHKEVRRTHQPKRCEDNDDDSSPNIPSDTNYPDSSQKFKQSFDNRTIKLR